MAHLALLPETHTFYTLFVEPSELSYILEILIVKAKMKNIRVGMSDEKFTIQLQDPMYNQGPIDLLRQEGVLPHEKDQRP